MNLAIQILASYPPSGKEKGYEAQPSGGVSAHYLHYDSDIHTPDPTNALRTAVSGTVIREVAALMACTSRVRASGGDFSPRI